MRIRLFALAVAAFGLLAAAPANAALLITVDKSAQRMTVELDGEPVFDWPVSTGARGLRHARRRIQAVPHGEGPLQPRVGRRADAEFDLLHDAGPRHPRLVAHEGARHAGLAWLRAAFGRELRNAVRWSSRRRWRIRALSCSAKPPRRLRRWPLRPTAARRCAIRAPRRGKPTIRVSPMPCRRRSAAIAGRMARLISTAVISTIAAVAARRSRAARRPLDLRPRPLLRRAATAHLSPRGVLQKLELDARPVARPCRLLPGLDRLTGLNPTRPNHAPDQPRFPDRRRIACEAHCRARRRKLRRCGDIGV